MLFFICFFIFGLIVSYGVGLSALGGWFITNLIIGKQPGYVFLDFTRFTGISFWKQIQVTPLSSPTHWFQASLFYILDNISFYLPLLTIGLTLYLVSNRISTLRPVKGFWIISAGMIFLASALFNPLPKLFLSQPSAPTVWWVSQLAIVLPAGVVFLWTGIKYLKVLKSIFNINSVFSVLLTLALLYGPLIFLGERYNVAIRGKYTNILLTIMAILGFYMLVVPILRRQNIITQIPQLLVRRLAILLGIFLPLLLVTGFVFHNSFSEPRYLGWNDGRLSLRSKQETNAVMGIGWLMRYVPHLQKKSYTWLLLPWEKQTELVNHRFHSLLTPENWTCGEHRVYEEPAPMASTLEAIKNTWERKWYCFKQLQELFANRNNFPQFGEIEDIHVSNTSLASLHLYNDYGFPVAEANLNLPFLTLADFIAGAQPHNRHYVNNYVSHHDVGERRITLVSDPELTLYALEDEIAAYYALDEKGNPLMEREDLVHHFRPLSIQVPPTIHIENSYINFQRDVKEKAFGANTLVYITDDWGPKANFAGNDLRFVDNSLDDTVIALSGKMTGAIGYGEKLMPWTFQIQEMTRYKEVVSPVSTCLHDSADANYYFIHLGGVKDGEYIDPSPLYCMQGATGELFGYLKDSFVLVDIYYVSDLGKFYLKLTEITPKSGIETIFFDGPIGNISGQEVWKVETLANGDLRIKTTTNTETPGSSLYFNKAAGSINLE